MEAESFFLKSNVYFKELKEIRSIQEDAAKEVCTYPFSWQELRSGRLLDTESWKEQFEEAGAQSFQGILILLPVKDSASLCIPAWIDRSGAFIQITGLFHGSEGRRQTADFMADQKRFWRPIYRIFWIRENGGSFLNCVCSCLRV